MTYKFAFCVDEFIVKKKQLKFSHELSNILVNSYFSFLLRHDSSSSWKSRFFYDTRKSTELSVIVYYENENGARNLDISCFKKNVPWKHLYLYIYILFINTKTIYPFILNSIAPFSNILERSSTRLDCEIIYIYIGEVSTLFFLLLFLKSITQRRYTLFVSLNFV